jgi:alpha-N-arabinofuranosidase
MKKKMTAALLGLAVATYALAGEFHVSMQGNDANDGSAAKPLCTIQRAADLARPGDVVTVHAGVYRERVDPPRGGTSDACRIAYQAAMREKVVITGAEVVKGWEKVSGDTWKVAIPNAVFGSFNPFLDQVQGEWCDRGGHTGTVYLNGEWGGEAASLEEVLKPSAARWFARVEGQNTIVWTRFPGVNPNEALVEVNVRQSVFYPSRPGINWITVRGFSLRQAATPWAGAMSDQVGLIGTHWSKGWIIENNTISHSICTAVTLGRYELPAGQKPPATAEGFVKSIQLALRDGWSKEKIGGHIVRNNHISHCEKNAIHGSLGCIFSEVYGNEIHDISVRG